MKAAIGMLVLFAVTKQVVCDSEVSITAFNETVSSNTEKPIFKKIAEFFKGAFRTGKRSVSPLIEGNSTLVPPTRNLSTYNTTEEQPSNHSAGITAAAGATKSPDETSNATEASKREGELNKTTSEKENSMTEGSFKSNATERHSASDSAVSESAADTTPQPALEVAGENASYPNTTDEAAPSASSEKEDELNKATPEAKENSTAEESLIDSDIQGHSDDDSVVSESALNKTVEPAERDLGDAPNPNTVEDESPEVQSATLEHQSDNGAGTVSEFELKPGGHEENCIVYINQLIEATLTVHKDRLDPLTLRDMKMVFSAPVLLSSVRGQVGFYGGKVIGLSQGNPTYECKVEEMGDQIRLKSRMYIKEAFIKYKGSVTLLSFGPEINVNARLSGITADLHVTVPKSGGMGKLESFRVGKIKRMEIDIDGLGIIDWSAEFITQQTTEVFTLVFRRSIEKEFRKALEDEIKKIPYM